MILEHECLQQLPDWNEEIRKFSANVLVDIRT
jgi:hypothetical protein